MQNSPGLEKAPREAKIKLNNVEKIMKILEIFEKNGENHCMLSFHWRLFVLGMLRRDKCFG